MGEIVCPECGMVYRNGKPISPEPVDQPKPSTVIGGWHFCTGTVHPHKRQTVPNGEQCPLCERLKVPVDQPKILSDEELSTAAGFGVCSEHHRKIAKAQHDKDMSWHTAEQKKLRAEVAEEIFEKIEPIITDIREANINIREDWTDPRNDCAVISGGLKKFESIKSEFKEG
jgi:hypothetical protein